MGIFSRKPSNCTICNKQITHKHKAKRGWGIKSPLCADCYLDKMHQSYDASLMGKCVICGIKNKITELWEPRWQWDMEDCCAKNVLTKKNQVLEKKKIFVVFVVTKWVL